MENQMKLELDAKRQRVRLQDDALPRQRVKLLDDEPAVDESHLSPWVDCNKVLPPEAGSWEVEDRARNIKLGQCWYGGKGAWTVPGWPFPKVFGAKVFWRGLNYDPKKVAA